MQNLKNQLHHMSEEKTDSFKEFVERVLSDPETADIDVTNKSNVMLAINYLNLKEKEHPGMTVKLRKEPYLEIVFVDTKEKQLEIQRQNSIKLFGDDSRDLKASLSDFKLNNLNRKRAYKLAVGIVDKKNDKNRGLYIHSKQFQVGKTYLANAITNELIDKGIKGAFLFAPSFARVAKDFDNLETRIQVLNNSHLLVIDDLGAEYNSEWFFTEVLMPILQYRLTHRHLTIITSNYSIIELGEKYQQKISDKKYVERLLSRIYELTDEVNLDE